MSNFVLASYQPLLQVGLDHLDQIGDNILIPQFHVDVLNELISEYMTCLKTFPTMYELSLPIVLVGDLHGNLIDLLRIFMTMGAPPRRKYLFLGDYVDRGEFSTETITLLMALAVKYLDSVFLIRGNHEFTAINSRYGFRDEIMDTYGDETIYNRFNELFTWMPLAALIDNTVLCVHGGLGPQLKNTEQLKQIKRPIITDDDPLINALLWSDPDSAFYMFNESQRGSGVTFGQGAVNSFFDETGVDMLVRAHQCVQNGIKDFALGKVVTVFSSSSYCGDNNKCGIMSLDFDHRRHCYTLNPTKRLKRESHIFFMHLKPLSSEQRSGSVANVASLRSLGGLMTTPSGNLPLMKIGKSSNCLVPKVKTHKLALPTLLPPLID